jgi:hypothetical protein
MHLQKHQNKRTDTSAGAARHGRRGSPYMIHASLTVFITPRFGICSYQGENIGLFIAHDNIIRRCSARLVLPALTMHECALPGQT